MRKLFVLLLAIGLVSSFAQVSEAQCCASKKAEAKKAEKLAAKDGASCFAGLDLTEDQKAKVAALKADCDETKCDKTSKAKMFDGLKSILTVTQFEAMKASCEKSGCEGKTASSDEAEDGSES